jgi:hypothetical protein
LPSRQSRFYSVKPPPHPTEMIPRPSIFFIAGVLLLASIRWQCIAGDAVFSRDGEKVYEIIHPDSGPAVNEIDLKKNTIRTIPSTQVSRSNALRGIACSFDGQLVCTSADGLWSLDPASGKFTKIREAPPGEEFWRVAYNSKLKRIFVTTSEKEPLYMLKSPGELISVRMRRHPYPSCLVFAASGELFFAAYGDLWHGEIKDDADEGEHYLSVVAYRYAPLATLETQNTTPAEIGVHDIGVSRDALYVQLSRMGGSGDGWFAHLARPPLKRDAEGFFDMEYDPAKRLPIYQRALQSLTIIGDDYRAGSICVSPDERRVHYVFERKHWLVTNGKTEELHLRQQ